jgi:hypothetical protein
MSSEYFKPLSPKDQENLKEFYYQDGNIFGRDKLTWAYKRQFPESKASRRAIANFLQGQEIHQRYTRPVMSRGIVRPVITKKPGYIQIDCINMQSYPYQGYNAAVQAVDAFSKKVWSFPCKGQTGANVVKALETFQKDGMVITYIQSDNGSEFVNEETAAWLQKHPSITWKNSKPHSPASNGIIESKNGQIKKLLFQLMKTRQDNDWVTLMPLVCKNLNSTMTFATKQSPDELQFNTTHHEEAGNMIQAAANKRYKTKGKGNDLQVGDHVRMRLQYDSANIKSAAKLGYYGEEVYKVTDIVHNNKYANLTSSYRLENVETGVKSKGIYSRGLLLPIPKDFTKIPKAVVRPGPVDEDTEEPEYEVESVLDTKWSKATRSKPSTKMWKVKWVGWKKSTWQPEEDLLPGAKDLIDEYNRLHS